MTVDPDDFEMVRYFTRVRPGGKHSQLMVLIVDDFRREIFEFKVFADELRPTADLVGALFKGELSVDEVSADEAKRLYPHIDVSALLAAFFSQRRSG